MPIAVDVAAQAALWAHAQFLQHASGGADAVIATAVSPKAFEQGYQSLKRGGTIVFVALPADNYVDLPIFETVLNGIHVVGSIVGTRQALREVFDLHAQGKTKVIYETRRLDDVNESFEEVLQGTMKSPRLVFDLTGNGREEAG